MARTIAKDHDQKRAQILKSAARVFAREGFDRASMSLLARECGISKANIYHYYDSKDALLFDILDSYLLELRERTVEMDMTGLAPPAQLRALLHEVLIAYQGMDDEHQLQTSAIIALPPEQQRILRSYQRDMVKQMSAILGEIAPEMFEKDKSKLHATTMSVFGMLNWFYMWNRSADATARHDYAELVADLTLGGIGGL